MRNAEIKDSDVYYWWIGYVICCISFSITTIAFFPGYMSPDSLAMLSDGRANFFNDLQSPFLSFIWGRIEKIYSGPVLMFLLQNFIFAAGICFFWKTTHRKSLKLGFWLVLFPLMPQIISQLSTVWKDVGLAVCLFTASSLIYYGSEKQNKIAILSSIPFLFVGFAARLNALPATLPIALWTGFVAYRVFSKVETTGKKSLIKSISLGFGYFAILAISVYTTTYAITNWRTVYPIQQIYLYDLAAISKDKSELLFPQYVLESKNISIEKVSSAYNIRSVNDLIFGDFPNKGDLPILPLSYDAEKVKSLRDKWFEEVLKNPAAYLNHKCQLFAQLLGFTRLTVSNPYWDTGFSSSPAEYQSTPNTLNIVLMKYFQLFRKYFFFRGYFWLLLCGFFLYQSIKNRLKDDWEIVFFLSTSNLLFTFAYFFVTPSTEFRYHFSTAIQSAIVTIFGSCSYFKGNTIKRFLSKIIFYFHSLKLNNRSTSI